MINNVDMSTCRTHNTAREKKKKKEGVSTQSLLISDIEVLAYFQVQAPPTQL